MLLVEMFMVWPMESQTSSLRVVLACRNMLHSQQHNPEAILCPVAQECWPHENPCLDNAMDFISK